MSLTTRSQNPRRPDLSPPVLPWEEWLYREATIWPQGWHQLYCGPTQSGKTMLARLVVRIRQYVVVLGTKPQDPSLDAYVEEGYLRISHWPPTDADLREMPTDDVRLIVWPEMKTRTDLRAWRPLYAQVIDDVFADGRWTIVIDEGLWMASPKGLDLGEHMSDLAYGSASNKVSMVLLTQRPANIPPVTWTSVMQAFLFHMGRVEDVRELASLGTYEPGLVIDAVHGLRGHQFLDLPVRAQAEWAISEVDPAWEFE